MKHFIAICTLILLQACSSSSTTRTATAEDISTAQASTANLVATSFGSVISLNASSSISDSFSTASCSGDSSDPGCTCEAISQGEFPLFITALPFGSEDTFGSANDEITLTSSDYCTDSSGSSQTGTGPDGNGLFAKFTIRQDQSSSCSSSTTFSLKTGSTGVFRNDSSGGLKVYGSFTVDVYGSESTLDCTLEIDSNGDISSSDCTDSSGTTILQTSSTCSLSQSDPQATVGLCDSYGYSTMSSTSDIDTSAAFLENYDGYVQWSRPHRAGGHVFSYNVVDSDEDGTYDWSLPDHLVDDAQGRNQRLFVNIYPEAETGEFDADAEGYPVKIIELPSNTSGYSAFVQAMVERYDGDGVDDMSGLEIPIKHWSIANEPYCDADDTTDTCEEDYLTLMQLTYDAVKAADENSVVFVGGAAPLLEPTTSNVSDDVENLYDYIFSNGGDDYMDVFAFHTAVGQDDPDIAGYVAEWHNIIGTSTRMWLTETGPRDVDNVTKVASTEAEEADWFEEHVTDALALGIEKVFICNTYHIHEDTTTLLSDLQTYLDSL